MAKGGPNKQTNKKLGVFLGSFCWQLLSPCMCSLGLGDKVSLSLLLCCEWWNPLFLMLTAGRLGQDCLLACKEKFSDPTQSLRGRPPPSAEELPQRFSQPLHSIPWYLKWPLSTAPVTLSHKARKQFWAPLGMTSKVNCMIEEQRFSDHWNRIRVQKQTLSSMVSLFMTEEWVIDFIYLFSKWFWEKKNCHVQKYKIRPLSNTIHNG